MYLHSKCFFVFCRGVTFNVFLFFNPHPHCLTPSHELVAITNTLRKSIFSVFSLTEWKILNKVLVYRASERFIVSAITAWWHRLVKRWARFWQFYRFPELHAPHSTLIQLLCTILSFWPFMIFLELPCEVLYVVIEPFSWYLLLACRKLSFLGCFILNYELTC